MISGGRSRLRSAAAYIIFSGLDASTPPPPDPPPPPAQHQVHCKPGTDNPMLMGPRRLQGLSQVDSSLESLAVIPALDIRHCYFPVADLQLELAAIPVIHCSRFHFPVSAHGIRCSKTLQDIPRHSKTFKHYATKLYRDYFIHIQV